MQVTLTISTEYPGEIVRALREQAERLRECAEYSIRYEAIGQGEVAYAVTHTKADELERVAKQILEAE